MDQRSQIYQKTLVQCKRPTLINTTNSGITLLIESSAPVIKHISNGDNKIVKEVTDKRKNTKLLKKSQTKGKIHIRQYYISVCQEKESIILIVNC